LIGTGIWDVLSSQDVINFIRRGIAERKDLDELAEKVMDHCLAPDSDWGGIGCDNMTILIVGLLNGRTKSEWYDWIAERVEKGVGYRTPDYIGDRYNYPRFRSRFRDVENFAGRGGPGGLPGSLASGDFVFSAGEGESHQVVYEAQANAEEYSSSEDDGQGDEDEEDESSGDNKAVEAATKAKEENTATAAGDDSTTTSRNDEVPHPSVKMEGLLDKSEDPLGKSSS
jgi:protein phosphatase 2C family protein 2/3